MKEMKKQDVAVFIKEKLRNKQPLIIAIDGRSASGKTTLAKELNELFLSEVIHMDDFFLQPEQRTEERLSEVGGNVDRERFLREVALPLKACREERDAVQNDVKSAVPKSCCKESDQEDSSDERAGNEEPGDRGMNRDILLSYRRYDCSTQELTECMRIRKSPLIIVEGVYSCHPYFGDIYDVRVFMDVENRQQQERIKKRNGADMLLRFTEEWIPKEDAYFEQFCIRENCDLLIS